MPQLWDDWLARVHQVIEKSSGTLEVSDLLTNGGALSEQDTFTWIVELVKQSVLLKMGRVTTTTANKINLPAFGFDDTDVLVADDGQSTSAAQVHKPDTSERVVEVGFFKAVMRLKDLISYYAINPEDFKRKVLAQFVEVVHFDAEKISLLADKSSGDTRLNQFNGIFKLLDANLVDVADNRLDDYWLGRIVDALPDEAESPNLQIMTARKAELNWRKEVAARQGALGESILTTNRPVSFGGYNLTKVPAFPTNVGTGSHCTYALLGDPKDIEWRFKKQATVEMQRFADPGLTVVVLRIQFGLAIWHPSQWVKAYNINATPLPAS